MSGGAVSHCVASAGETNGRSGAVLVFNAGSSTLKAEVRRVSGGAAAEILAQASEECHSGEFAAATARALASLAKQVGGSAALAAAVSAVGHRVVHGGEQLRATTRIDAALIAAIEALSPLAPLHNPAALAVIHASASLLPAALPAYAAFDTAFFAKLPAHVVRLPLPRALVDRYGVRRFGFHGLAHRALLDMLASRMSCGENTRVISLQLGQGCSITASRGGAPLATSMGFTPLGGLVMGTRPGDMDPGALLYLLRSSGLDAAAFEHELHVNAGLKGLSGVSGDMRELLGLADDGHAGAELAITAFCERVQHEIGGSLATLGGAEALLFGGGIGEHAPAIRARICSGLEVLGIELNAEANALANGAAVCISAAHSPVAVWVIATDEAAVIARDVMAAVAL